MWFIFLLIHFFSFVLQLFSCKMGIRLPRKIFRGTRASPNENGCGKCLIPNYEVRDREYSKENAVNNITAIV